MDILIDIARAIGEAIVIGACFYLVLWLWCAQRKIRSWASRWQIAYGWLANAISVAAAVAVWNRAREVGMDGVTAWACTLAIGLTCLRWLRNVWFVELEVPASVLTATFHPELDLVCCVCELDDGGRCRVIAPAARGIARCRLLLRVRQSTLTGARRLEATLVRRIADIPSA